MEKKEDKKEDKITRTTIYLPRYLYKEIKKRRESENFCLSKVVCNYLETIFFGNDPGDLRFQLFQAKEMMEKARSSLEAWSSRVDELQKLVEAHEKELRNERKLFERFCKWVNSRVEGARDFGIPIDCHQIASVWRKQFFPNNDIDAGVVEDVLNRFQRDGGISFEFFCRLRNAKDLDGGGS